MSLFSKIGDAISSGIGNISGGVGHFLNDLTGASNSMHQQYNYNQKGAMNDMQRSIYLWNLQNEYNHPAAQIARMAEAGIDVNPMTYAVGNGSMSTTASSISSPATGSVGSGSSVNPIQTAMSVIQGIQGYKQSKATVEQIGDSIRNADKITEATVKKLNAETERIKLENKYNKDTGSAPNEPGSIRTAKSVWNFITKPFGGFNRDVEVYDPTLPKFGSNVRRRK